MPQQDIRTIRQATMKELGIGGKAEVDYITKELLEEYKDAKDAKRPRRHSVDENGSKVADASYTDYGHKLVFKTENGKKYVYYSNGPEGQNYKCGNENRWKWRVDYGDEFSEQGTCRRSDKWYKLYCPSC